MAQNTITELKNLKLTLNNLIDTLVIKEEKIIELEQENKKQQEEMILLQQEEKPEEQPPQEQNIKSFNDTCPICLENNKSTGIVVLDCGHSLCLTCYFAYVKTTGHGDPKNCKCPLCRAKIVQTDLTEELRAMDGFAFMMNYDDIIDGDVTISAEDRTIWNAEFSRRRTRDLDSLIDRINEMPELVFMDEFNEVENMGYQTYDLTFRHLEERRQIYIDENLRRIECRRVEAERIAGIQARNNLLNRNIKTCLDAVIFVLQQEAISEDNNRVCLYPRSILNRINTFNTSGVIGKTWSIETIKASLRRAVTQGLLRKNRRSATGGNRGFYYGIPVQ